MFGQGGVFEAVAVRPARGANFYQRYMSGEKIKAGWVNQSDISAHKMIRFPKEDSR